MNRAEAEKIAAQIDAFWRERGYAAGAEAVIDRSGGEQERSYVVKTRLVNGLPPGFTSANGRVADVVTAPISALKFARTI